MTNIKICFNCDNIGYDSNGLSCYLVAHGATDCFGKFGRDYIALFEIKGEKKMIVPHEHFDFPQTKCPYALEHLYDEDKEAELEWKTNI